MSNTLSPLSQKWVNYFPLGYNARQYKFSNSRVFLDGAASHIYTEYLKVQKYLKDSVFYGNTETDIGIMYTMDTEDNYDLTSCEVTGYIGETSVTGTVPVYSSQRDFFDHFYFGIPTSLRATGKSFETIDAYILPTGYCETTTLNECSDSYNGFDVYFVCLNIFGNTDIYLGTDKFIELRGYFAGGDYLEKVERIPVGFDGYYKSNHRWAKVTTITCHNLASTYIKVQSGDYNFPLRYGTVQYYADDRAPSVPFVAWESDYYCFSVNDRRFTEANEMVYDPKRVVYLADEYNTIVTGITDFNMDQFGKHIMVLNNDKLYWYEFEEELPSGYMNLVQEPACPYNMVFEVYDYSSIAIKPYSKYIGHPYDNECGIVMTTPSGGEFYVNKNGTLTTYSSTIPIFFTDKVILTLPEPGVYKFRFEYWSDDEKVVKIHEMLYHHELKKPVKVIDVPGSFTGVAQLGWHTLGLYKDWKMYEYIMDMPAAYYDTDSLTLNIAGIVPINVSAKGHIFTGEYSVLGSTAFDEPVPVFIGDV